MPSYWPSGLELSDTASPMNILLDACNEWKTNSEGLLDLVMQTGQSNSGNDMIFVHVKHIPTNRTASLLSIVMRPGLPYPARLQPFEEDLPNIFKKEYPKRDSRFGISAASQALKTLESFEVNQWVAETPSEFRSKLAEAFNLGSTKSIILSLLAVDECAEMIERSEQSSQETDTRHKGDYEEDVSG